MNAVCFIPVYAKEVEVELDYQYVFITYKVTYK